jgi:hypothetical protein
MALRIQWNFFFYNFFAFPRYRDTSLATSGAKTPKAGRDRTARDRPVWTLDTER